MLILEKLLSLNTPALFINTSIRLNTSRACSMIFSPLVTEVEFGTTLVLYVDWRYVADLATNLEFRSFKRILAPLEAKNFAYS